ncbi:MAG: hypothetical protein RL458_1404, partial [Pseudomonadota bacterium]
AEQWRERLLGDPSAVNIWLERYPDTRVALPTLLDKARAEVATGQRGRRYRELFRLVRATLEAPDQSSISASS